MRYKLTDHTADIGIRLSNRTLKGIFEDAAFALFDILCDIKNVKPVFERTISVDALNQRSSVQASDYEELLNLFLNVLLKEFTVENNLISKVEVRDIRTDNTGRQTHNARLTVGQAQRVTLSAIISGQPYDPKRHTIKTEIKAVTFHNLSIKKTKSGFIAEVVFDV